jgi:hypothetical protein
MWFSERDPAPSWEDERLRSLPEAERALVQRWALRRLMWSWRMWLGGLLFSQVALFSAFAAGAVRGAGGGRVAVIAVWVVFHAVFGAALGRVVERTYRRVLRELLLTLDAHENANGDSCEATSSSPNCRS